MAAPTAVADKFATANGLRLHYLEWANPGAPVMRQEPPILSNGQTAIQAGRLPLPKRRDRKTSTGQRAPRIEGPRHPSIV